MMGPAAPPPAPSPPPPPAPPPAEVLKAPGPRKSPWSFGAGVGASATGAVSPEPLLAVRAFLETRLDGSGAWAPALRLGFEHAPGATFGAPQGTSATFDWTVGTLEFCPVRAVLGSVALLPCSRFAAGALHGRGVQIAQPSESTKLWLDVGVLGEARWVPKRPLFVELYGGLIVPLVHDRFHFDAPDITIHQAPDLGATGGADVGLSF